MTVRRRSRHWAHVVLALVTIASVSMVLVSASPASAIPAFARRYGMQCSACHTAWPALNDAGYAFKMSGYRRYGGVALTPVTPDIELADGRLTLPAFPPVAFRVDMGFDFQRVRRTAADGTTATRTGSSFDVNELELLAGSPLGKHLSFFVQYDLFETEIERPTGPGEANDTGSRRSIKFETEGPRVPGMAKLIWNSVLPDTIAPPDSLNVLGGVNELPLAFSPEHRRLSVAPYLIYTRRALDLLGGTPVDDLLTDDEQRQLLRLSEEQIGVELNGMLPLGTGGMPTLEYHLGVTNGSNKDSDPNTEKDLFARLAVRWHGQSLGLFGYWSPDIYTNGMRTDHAIVAGGLFSGTQHRNEVRTFGPDLTLSLVPFSLPLWLETQALVNKETNPTGFRRSFEWWGGFAQLNWKPLDPVIVYARYDGLRGKRFDDTPEGGVTGPVRPREWDAVVGLQWYVLENFKVLGEYARHEFTNRAASPHHQRVEGDVFSIRGALAF